ncbi:hypothetical protein [Thermococcus piezophilus]|uniref:hypothetical protein n=1 Tax=Thermococcus piezophilus TaxID=1712654 RepID=UPI000B02322C|nr:hypothetical protein [Thermococcus piezophilus]
MITRDIARHYKESMEPFKAMVVAVDRESSKILIVTDMLLTGFDALILQICIWTSRSRSTGSFRQ